jgi:hypothetical protein
LLYGIKLRKARPGKRTRERVCDNKASKRNRKMLHFSIPWLRQNRGPKKTAGRLAAALATSTITAAKASADQSTKENECRTQ